MPYPAPLSQSIPVPLLSIDMPMIEKPVNDVSPGSPNALPRTIALSFFSIRQPIITPPALVIRIPTLKPVMSHARTVLFAERFIPVPPFWPFVENEQLSTRQDCPLINNPFNPPNQQVLTLVPIGLLSFRHPPAALLLVKVRFVTEMPPDAVSSSLMRR